MAEVPLGDVPSLQPPAEAVLSKRRQMTSNVGPRASSTFVNYTR